MSDYVMLMEENGDLTFQFQKEATARIVAEYVKKVGKVGTTILDKQIGVPLLGTATGLVASIKTGNHIKKLKAMEPTVHNDCTCGDCDGYLSYALQKKKMKLGKTIVGMIPIVGTVSTVGHMGKGAVKGIKGKKGQHRLNVAIGLWHAMRDSDGGYGCPSAKLIVTELCGHDQMEKIKVTASGYNQIVKKLASK